MSEQQERRLYKRVDFDAGTIVVVDDHVYNCELLDVSLQGAKLALSGADLNENQSVVLRIRLSNDAEIEMNTAVTRYKDDLLALKCESIDVESMGHLRRVIDLNTGDDVTGEEINHILGE